MSAGLTRRSLLAGLGTLGLAAGCGGVGGSGQDGGVTPERLTYGDDPSQWADLSRPVGPSRGIVVVIHGGFWRAQYDASLGEPLAADLVARGWTTLNLEYRRVGAGGGFPATFDDVSAAIDLLAEAGVDTTTVVTLGHSAGGHLATWAAARTRFETWADARVAVTHVISQAGVVDLGASARDSLGGGAAEALLGGEPGDVPAVYDQADPMRQLPLDVPVWCVHGRDDDIVPFAQSEEYVARATAAGATVELVAVEGDHFVVIDPGSDAWARQVEILDSIAPA